jgi:D-sedoheptulose 7-phosphate isomerase
MERKNVMKDSSLLNINKFFSHHSNLDVCKNDIIAAIEALIKTYQRNGKVLVCGNGGSAADSEHIVGELMKGFLLKRPLKDDDKKNIKEKEIVNGKQAEYIIEHLQGALPAISLVSHTALGTAISNDVAADMIFAQQVYGYGKTGDIVIGISTSGNSQNVVNAMCVGKALGLTTIGLTGEKESNISNTCDITIRVPVQITYKIQEEHLKIYHLICAIVENEFFEL